MCPQGYSLGLERTETEMEKLVKEVITFASFVVLRQTLTSYSPGARGISNSPSFYLSIQSLR